MFSCGTALTPIETRSAIVRDPLIVAPDTLVRDAIAQMSALRSQCFATSSIKNQLEELHAEIRSSCVVVTEQERVVGILTERDVVRLCAQQHNLEKLPIRSVMAQSIVTLRESEFNDLSFIVGFLKQHGIRHLPILDDQGCLIGLATHESLRQVSRPVDLLRLRVAREVMTAEVVCGMPNDSMLFIAQLMADSCVSSVVIVEPLDQQTDLRIPVGILTERDLVQCQAIGINLTSVSASTVMSTPIFTIDPEESLWNVQKVMEQRFIRRVVTIGPQGELVGIVTQTSLLQALQPIELYALAEVLEKKVVELEAEKVAILENRTTDLEYEVQVRTFALQKKAAREKLLADVATQTRSSLSLQNILDTAVHQVRQVLCCDRASILQFAPEWTATVVSESTESTDVFVGQQITDACFQEHCASYQQGKVRIVSDIYTTEMSECHRDLLIRNQIRSKVLVPLLCGDKLWGLLSVSESQRPRIWQSDDIALLQTLSSQLALGIQQATIHQHLQAELTARQQAEARLKAQNALLAKVAKDKPLAEIYSAAIDSIEKTFQNSIASIMLLNSENQLQLAAAPHLPSHYCEAVEHIGASEGVGSCGTAAFRKEAVIVADISTSPLWNNYREVALGFGLRACWSIPIFSSDGQVLGTFGLYYPKVHNAQPNEIEVIQQLANIIGIAIEQKQAETALRQYERVVSTTSDGIALVDRNYNYVLANHVYVERSGKHREDIIGHSVASLVGDAAFKNIIQPHLDLSLAGDAPQYEGWFKYAKTGQLYLKVTHNPYYEKDGSISGVVVTTHDLTASKQAEENLRKSEAALLEAQRVAHIGSWAFEPQSQKITWSKELFRMFGRDPAQVEPHYLDYLQLIHPEDRELLNQRVVAAVAEGTPYNIIYRIYWPDGSLRYHEGCADVERDEAGQVSKLFGTALDITERRQTQVQLQNLIEGTAATTGKDFFPALVKHVAKAVNVSYVAVTEQIDGKLHTLAFWANGALQSNRSYDPGYEPCGRTLAEGKFYCKASLMEMFPNTIVLPEMDVTSYLGIALRNEQDSTIGNLCILSPQTIQNPEETEALLRVFAARAAAELERKRATQALEQLNQDLENEVERRTADLQASENRYRALMDGASDAILQTDVQGNLIAANQQAVLLSGYSHDELTQLHITSLIPPESMDKAIVHFQSITESRPSGMLESVLLRKDGTRTPIEVTGSSIVLNGEHFTQGILRDVSERVRLESLRHQAEDYVRESQQFLQTVIETFPLSVFWKDRNSVYLGCNHNLLRDANLASTTDIVGKTDYDMPWGETEAELFRADDQHVIETDTAKLGIIETQTQADGNQIWLETNKLPLRDLEGRVIGVLGTYQDITARKQAQTELQLQSRQKQLLWNVTQAMRRSLDLEVIVNTAVQEVHQLLQVDRVAVYEFLPDWSGKFIAESVSDGWIKLVSAPEKVWEDTYLQETRGGRFKDHETLMVEDIYQADLRPCHVELLEQFQARAYAIAPISLGEDLWGLFALYCNDGPHTWSSWEIELLQQISSQLAIAIQQSNLLKQVQQELNDRVEAQRQLTQRNEELARATRLKDEFLANMSHELRTPLNAILGMTEGLSEMVFGAVNERQVKALETIERSGSHLLSLINDILDVAKIESGHIELDCTPVPVAALCQSSLAFIKQQAHQKQISIQTKLPPDLPPLLVDERRIRQVSINLLNNAVKFTPEGGQITLEAQVLSTGGVRLTFSDTGIGIAPENISRLFQPFIQIDSALNRQYQGTGLGLSLVKRIVELHSGQVHLTSKIGVGSCFMIDLPAAEPTAEGSFDKPTQAQTGLSSSSQPVSSAPLILLAEDNAANVSTISSYLEAKGYRLVVARNGQEAIDLARSVNPDLILMDIQMPGMDGFVAMQEIRRDPKFADLPIVALTALAMTGDRERCLIAGANDYISKPIKLKNLAQTIQKMLAASAYKVV